ncbi:MAG: isovaleryl-CoA dehydrogenase [Steroidobacteraceae bacterium]|nr:isovaleryl-CoA dehydrogenase [Steroidobacteraceae bacterium]
MQRPGPRDPHEVFNQPPPLSDYDPFGSDAALAEALQREGGGHGMDRVRAFARRVGSAEVLALGELANRHGPILHTRDRFGRRIDEIEFHPAWHELMRLGIEAGLHSLPWSDPRPGSHVLRAALVMLRHQVEEGVSCPLTMTFAAIPTLRLAPSLAADWEPRLLSNRYDPRTAPAAEKSGAIVGMAMTERQGGTDVRANTTRAAPGGPDGAWRLDGHKWFCSAPQSDAFLVLAQAGGGLTCFILPRVLPDGSRNAIHVQRLKDKVGNRSNASSEVEFHGALAWPVGPEGRGVASIMEMVRHTRLDCALGSAATLRRAVAEATHHAAHRDVSGAKLAAQPLMQNVLADLCLESEAATALAMRLARAFDGAAAGDLFERSFARVATAVAKYWITKRAVAAVAEALECTGGNGFVEESPLARLYRDVPVNAIWEGSGNVQCLDVLRALAREPEAAPALLTEIRAGASGEPRLAALADELAAAMSAAIPAEGSARVLVERIAVGLQASLLARHAPAAVADAFCASRLAGRGGLFGTLPPGCDLGAIVERATPRPAA